MKINITENIKISMRGYTIINVNAYWEENGRRYAVKACDGLKIDSNDKEVILRGSYDGRNVEWKLCDKGNYITAELTIQSKNEVYIDALCAFRGEIKPEEAKHHPDKNIITRAMGVKEEVEADIYEYRLKKGDMILMCTDGLSNMVEDEDMFDIVKGARDIVEAVQMLIEKANSNGGRDNIGVVLAEPLADEVSAW